MNSPRAAQPDPLLQLLTQTTDEAAAVALFFRLCRHSPALRHWLREDYARDPTVRARFDKAVSSEMTPGDLRFTDLSAASAAWRQERAALKARLSERPFGGLSRAEVESLVLRCQAGGLDLGAFLLAHDWRKAGAAASTSPSLVLAATAFVDDALRSGQLRRLRHLGQAARFLEAYADKPKRRTTVSSADWWKLHALLFILKHPCPSYRTRDLIAHLATNNLAVSAKEIRRFCARHRIARDMRAGRPKGNGSQRQPAKAHRSVRHD